MQEALAELTQPTITAHATIIKSPRENNNVATVPPQHPAAAVAPIEKAMPSPEDDVEDEEMEEVDVIEMHGVDFELLQNEFEKLEKVIDEIKAIPLPAPPIQQSPHELIPELAELDQCIENLEAVIIRTTPQRLVHSDTHVRLLNHHFNFCIYLLLHM